MVGIAERQPGVWRDSDVLNINIHEGTAAAWRVHSEVTAGGSVGRRQGWDPHRYRESREPKLPLLILFLDASRIGS